MARRSHLDSAESPRGRRPLLRPTSLTRTVVFMAVNAVVFAGVCAFWRFLGTGHWITVSPAAMWRGAMTPFEALARPLDVPHHPWMILVFGMLLGVIVVTPIIVSVLYRLRMALLFLILTAVIGQMPAIAFAAGLGCLLAAHTRLRSSLPILAGLLGLIPVLVALWLLNSLGMLLPADTTSQPVWRWLLYMPFFAAHIAAIAALAIVLALARISHFRSGVIWPVLVVLLVAPLGVFHARVGNDELYFALLRRTGPSEWLLPTDALFPDMPVEQFRTTGGAGLTDALLRQRADDELQRHRQALLSACSEFVERFALSPRTPEALWIQAQCHSLRSDVAALDDGWVRCTAGRVAIDAEPTWRVLAKRYENSPQAAVARLKLAELALRQRDVGAAHEWLTAAQAVLEETAAALAERDGQLRRPGVFPDPVRYPSHSYYVACLDRVSYLLWLIDRNGVLDKSESAEALAAWSRIDPADADAAVQYLQLAETFEKTDLGDNLRLATALASGDLHSRAELLLTLADVEDLTDAGIEANFELGRLVMDAGPAKLPAACHDAETYFRRIIDEAPNPWQARAAQRLVQLTSRQ